MPTHKPFPQTTPIVRTQFVSNHNSVEFVRKKAQTISFVERGFERLGLSHQAVSLLWCSYMVKSFSPQESFSWRRAGRFWFLAIFPSPFYELLPFPFILASVFLSFVHVQDRHSKTDTCPISPYPKWSGVVEKAGEYGSVRCRVLNGSKGSLPRSFILSSIPFSTGTGILDFFLSCFYTIFSLSSMEALDWSRTESSSAVSPMLFCSCIYSVWAKIFLGLGLWAPTNKWSWPKNGCAPHR